MGINYKRKLFHASFGTFLLILSYYVDFKYFKLFLFFLFLGMCIFELLRLKLEKYLPMKFFWKPLLKADESKRLTDAWFYLLGINFSVFFVSTLGFRLILSVLSYADPVAAILGHHFGKTRPFGNKSIEGSFFFFLASLIIGLILLKSFSLKLIFFCLLASAIEFFTKRDNLWLPVGLTIFWKVAW